MSAMASPLRAAAAMLKKHAPGALCFEIDLTRQSLVAGATRAVAVLVPDLSLEVVPGSLAKLHPQGFQAIPVSQTFRQGVATLAPSQSSHHFLLGGVAVTGFLLLAEGKSEKHQGVIELLKEQLSSVTEKVGQLETENRKLREDASKRERELSHELQTEISRQAHKENMAQIRNDEIRLEIEKLRVMKGGDEGGDKRSGEKPENQKKTKPEEDKNKNEDKEPTYKKIFRCFMYPSTAEEFVKSIYNNCVNLTKVGGFGVFLVGMSRCDWLSFYTGGAKGLDTRNEILDIGICPCGIPWPEVCCKCGRSLPPFAADAAFLFGHASVGKDGTHTSAGQSVSKIGPAN